MLSHYIVIWFVYFLSEWCLWKTWMAEWIQHRNVGPATSSRPQASYNRHSATLSSLGPKRLQSWLCSSSQYPFTIDSFSWIPYWFDWNLLQWESVYHTQELDDECVTEMAVSVAKSRKAMHKILSDWLYDYNTATYLLLWQRKQRCKSIRLMSEQVLNPRHYFIRVEMIWDD